MDQRSPEQRRSALQLILGGAERGAEAPAAAAAYVACTEMFAREIRAEAIEIEAWYGPNVYSRFLLKHGRRPDPNEAATIGRIMGTQVKASNGTMQPRLTKAERAALRDARQRKKAEHLRDDEIDRLIQAVAILCQGHDRLEELATNSQLDESNFGTLAYGVLALAQRFAEGLGRGKRASRTPKPA